MADFKKPSVEELKKKLDDLQFQVTQKEATEPPFQNKYWNNKEIGLYVDIITGEPLFTSMDKFDSGTGWPCFTKPINISTLVYKEDHKMWRPRVEVRSKLGDAHLGHVFDDGPEESGGQRYCINSASLRFIPLEDIKKDPTYSEWVKIFEET